ncbi:hypothetical protein TH53_19865 [Pedobacter lusitanus]|uniref:Uncharacterized protein n=1 Tax=Pedobacter lusitanus TaxID=1503925 RepID=A0A0D0GE27_9SPHI|nr:hypothetical protein [Pedobacter lusitanus]KIO75597.1 hypothetical protein TH53_19865 [Pedobacter lusitanus]
MVIESLEQIKERVRISLKTLDLQDQETEDRLYHHTVLKIFTIQAVKYTLYKASSEVSCSHEIDYVDHYDYSAGHNGMTGEIDKESITGLEVDILKEIGFLS